MPALSVVTPVQAPPAFEWHLPRGFPTPFVPIDNPMSEAKVSLGRRLFFETRLSVTGRYSCGSCHDPARSYSDGRARALGATGASLPHGAMALVNVAYNLSYGWQQPSVGTLEAQMRQPLLNRHPVEIGLAGREAAVVSSLQADVDYPRQFAAAFRAGPSVTRIIQAIAAFERTLIDGRSPFDAYVFAGDHQALSVSAKRGMTLFFSARVGCAGCHSGFNFSGPWRDAQGATGTVAFADEGLGDGAMRVPTLRNIALTAPYMHDGRYATLDAVLDHYERIGALHREARLKAFTLSAGEREDLKAFLESLTDREIRSPQGGK